MLALWTCAWAAEPWEDPAADAIARDVRATGADAMLGAGTSAPDEVARRARALAAPDPRAAVSLAPELAGGVVWVARPVARLTAGELVPDNLAGDLEPGRAGGALGVEGALYAGPVVLRLTPEVEGGLAPATGSLRLPTAWAGVHWRGLDAGFGRRDRWLGPARHGAVALSENAAPPWMGGVALEGRLPGALDRVGRLRADVEVGWLDRPRGDVAHPGLLLMDLRWLPVPQVELGVTRLSIFGGEGRPPVDLGQLLLPTEPHVEDDPDQLLPDQNELAVFDLRITLPLAKWAGGPVRHVEGWWQYGGEDMVMRELGPIPTPSLAGVGNLYGGEIAVGPVVVTGEYSRLMDDYFRWYVGHRVYHDGFSQDGRVMGHFGGPDSETAWGAVAVEGGAWRARAWGEHVRRVGVVEVLQDHVFTLSTEERRVRGGVDAGWTPDGATWVRGGLSVERVEGDDFFPGVEDRAWRGWAGVEHLLWGPLRPEGG